MGRSVSFDAMLRRIAPRHFIAPALAALLPLLIITIVDSPSATSIASIALALGLLIAAGLAHGLAALVPVTSRLVASYRRRAGVAVESNDPPLHPVRPRAPGLA